MLIAIITPTYNRPELLRRLHDSLVQQVECDIGWIHIVVDDNSSSRMDWVDLCNHNRLHYHRLASNVGAPRARNVGLELAEKLDASHVCFVDDDDYLQFDALTVVHRYLCQYPSEKHLIFRSFNAATKASVDWPIYPTRASWIVDVVRDRRYGSDNFVVLKMCLIRGLRFSALGRTQREWTFFAAASRRCDQVLVCPECIRVHEYLPNGLTMSTAQGNKNFGSIWNILHRSCVYFTLHPNSFVFFVQLIKQVAIFPLRVLLVLLFKLRSFWKDWL